MRVLRSSVHRVARNIRLVVVQAGLVPVSAFGPTACSGGVNLRAANADAASPLDHYPADDAGVLLPADAEAGAPSGAGDAEVGVVSAVDAAARVPATVARMNDVSILFPLPARAGDLDLLMAPSAMGSRGVLFPSELYAAAPLVGVQTGPIPPTYFPYDDFRVVAMRIDPCFASLAPDPHGAGCTAQLRLVFQTMAQFTDAGGFANDSAVHVFYDLSRDELFALARALVALRIASEQGDELGALAPHPIMVRQGLSGAMAQGVQSLILQYAGGQNLVRIALETLADAGPVGVWRMSAFDVGGTPKATIPFPIPSLASADGGSVFVEEVGATFGAGGGSYLVQFIPTTTSADNLTPLGNGQPGSLAASDRQAALDSLVRIENPRDNSADTINCLSCHMAAPLENLVARPLFSFDDTAGPLAYQPDGTIVTSADMGPTADSQLTNIHVFSYLGAKPQISQRVVNETAAVVEYLNDSTP